MNRTVCRDLCRDCYSYMSVATEVLVIACTHRRYESGRGQPHSKTLARFSARYFLRKVLECGCPLPLFRVARTYAIKH